MRRIDLAKIHPLSRVDEDCVNDDEDVNEKNRCYLARSVCGACITCLESTLEDEGDEEPNSTDEKEGATSDAVDIEGADEIAGNRHRRPDTQKHNWHESSNAELDEQNDSIARDHQRTSEYRSPRQDDGHEQSLPVRSGLEDFEPASVFANLSIKFQLLSDLEEFFSCLLMMHFAFSGV